MINIWQIIIAKADWIFKVMPRRNKGFREIYEPKWKYVCLYAIYNFFFVSYPSQILNTTHVSTRFTFSLLSLKFYCLSYPRNPNKKTRSWTHLQPIHNWKKIVFKNICAVSKDENVLMIFSCFSRNIFIFIGYYSLLKTIYPCQIFPIRNWIQFLKI